MDIVRLDPSQKKQAAALYARAFFDYPQFTCYYPSREWRTKHFTRCCGVGIDAAVKNGQLYTTPDLKGIIGWFPPGKTHLTTGIYLQVPGFLGYCLRLGWKNLVRTITCEDYAAKVHGEILPGPHWYLWGLAVDPACQGQGIGTMLMQPGLATADQQGMPCYLETHDETNIPFYQKRGFELVRSEQVPGVGLRFWCFVRMPQR